MILAPVHPFSFREWRQVSSSSGVNGQLGAVGIRHLRSCRSFALAKKMNLGRRKNSSIINFGCLAIRNNKKTAHCEKDSESATGHRVRFVKLCLRSVLCGLMAPIHA